MLRKFFIALAVVTAALTLLLAGWYAIDGQPLDETAGFIDRPGHVAEQTPEGDWIFIPSSANRRGIVIMHGALIKPQSYAATAAFFAQRGYTVFMPHGGFWRLPIMAVERTVATMSNSGISDWYLIGHSMGGLAALELLRSGAPNVRAVALWGAGMPFDFTDIATPLLFLWGDDDGILPPERFEPQQANLPADTRFVTVKGGNHRNFAMYSHQFFDNEGSLDWRAQTRIAHELTNAFFSEQGNARSQ